MAKTYTNARYFGQGHVNDHGEFLIWNDEAYKLPPTAHNNLFNFNFSEKGEERKSIPPKNRTWQLFHFIAKVNV